MNKRKSRAKLKEKRAGGADLTIPRTVNLDLPAVERDAAIIADLLANCPPRSSDGNIAAARAAAFGMTLWDVPESVVLPILKASAELIATDDSGAVNEEQRDYLTDTLKGTRIFILRF